MQINPHMVVSVCVCVWLSLSGCVTLDNYRYIFTMMSNNLQLSSPVTRRHIDMNLHVFKPISICINMLHIFRIFILSRQPYGWRTLPYRNFVCFFFTTFFFEHFVCSFCLWGKKYCWKLTETCLRGQSKHTDSCECAYMCCDTQQEAGKCRTN